MRRFTRRNIRSIRFLPPQRVTDDTKKHGGRCAINVASEPNMLHGLIIKPAGIISRIKARESSQSAAAAK
jgi:hypothetical protein